MVEMAYSGTKIKIDMIVELHTDKDGYVLEPEKWNETIAGYLAKMEKIDAMTVDHWKLVHYIRDFYLRFGVAPPPKLICKQTGATMDRINELFPGGLTKGACKIAGLPAEAWCWRRIR